MHAIQTRAAVPRGLWTVDRERSSVEFSIRHLMVATVRGRFGGFEGTLDAAGPGPPRAVGAVEVATIDTGEAIRDERLRGPDFFDAGRSPTIRFASRAVEQRDGNRFRIVGELTIKDTTREIELHASEANVRDGCLELDLRGELSRRDFGIESDELLEAGISDKVRLALRISLVRIPTPIPVGPVRETT